MALLLIIPLAVFLWCVFAPVEIDVRAPDRGDLGTLKISHPAVELEIWLPPSVPLAWAFGELVLPSMSGHVIGIPVDRALIHRWLDRGLRLKAFLAKRSAARPKRPKPATPAAPKRIVPVAKEQDALAAMLPARFQLPAHVARVAWGKAKPRVVAAGKVELFEADLVFGTGEPAVTGLVCGVLWQVAALLPAPFRLTVEAHWAAFTLRIEGEARVLIFPWRAARAVLSLGLAAWKEWRLLAAPRARSLEPWQISRTETAAPSNRS